MTEVQTQKDATSRIFAALSTLLSISWPDGRPPMKLDKHIISPRLFIRFIAKVGAKRAFAYVNFCRAKNYWPSPQEIVAMARNSNLFYALYRESDSTIKEKRGSMIVRLSLLPFEASHDGKVVTFEIEDTNSRTIYLSVSYFQPRDECPVLTAICYLHPRAPHLALVSNVICGLVRIDKLAGDEAMQLQTTLLEDVLYPAK